MGRYPQKNLLDVVVLLLELVDIELLEVLELVLEVVVNVVVVAAAPVEVELVLAPSEAVVV